MPILGTGNTFATGDQITAASLNSAVTGADFILNGAAVTGASNTTDETSCNINASGEIEVKDSGITTAKINDGAVTSAKLGASSVLEAAVSAGAITTAKLGADCVTEAKIADAAVESEHVNNNVISGQTEMTAEPADDDELLISDQGTVKRIDISDLAKSRFFPQAYGVVTYDTGTPALNGAYNCSLNSDTTTTRVIDITNAMADTNYVVIAGYGDTASISNSEIVVSIGSASQFTLLPGSSENANRTMHFAVFGNRA